MHLSVIIPCYNAAATLAAQLDALARQQWAGVWEVVVADNGSTDRSRAIAAAASARLPRLRIVDASGRRGAAHARNVGAGVAAGDALAFCDADDEVAAGWLAAIAQALERHDFVASALEFSFDGGEKRHLQNMALQRVAYPPYWQHAGGSGLAVRRRIHEQVGGFDESLPYLEDTDYCFRVQRLGHELFLAEAAVIRVRPRARSLANFNQARHWAEYNVLLNRRYGEGRTIARPWRCHLQGWRALFRNSPRLFEAQGRRRWIRALGTQCGLLQGALRFGVPPVR